MGLTKLKEASIFLDDECSRHPAILERFTVNVSQVSFYKRNLILCQWLATLLIAPK